VPISTRADRAIADYSRAIEIDPKYIRAYFARGGAYEKKGQLDRAISDYTRVLEIDPKAIQIYPQRGVAYERKHDFDRAIADHSSWIRFNPDVAKGYVVRGNAYAGKGDRDAAIADYTRALGMERRTREDDFFAHYARGLAYRGSGKLELAIADFSKCMENDPKDALAVFNRGFTYEQKGEANRAINDYRAALRLNPNHKASREGLDRLGAPPAVAAPITTNAEERDITVISLLSEHRGMVGSIALAIKDIVSHVTSQQTPQAPLRMVTIRSCEKVPADTIQILAQDLKKRNFLVVIDLKGLDARLCAP
jgi:tetratricopeptide (TPR) repeat protein